MCLLRSVYYGLHLVIKRTQAEKRFQKAAVTKGGKSISKRAKDILASILIICSLSGQLSLNHSLRGCWRASKTDSERFSAVSLNSTKGSIDEGSVMVVSISSEISMTLTERRIWRHHHHDDRLALSLVLKNAC